MREKQEGMRENISPSCMDSKPLRIPADVLGWQWEHYMPVYSFISGRNTIWQQFARWQLEWIADLVELSEEGRASLQSLCCLQALCITSEHLFLCPLVWVLMCLCVELLFHTELGFSERPLSAEGWGSAFSHWQLSKDTVESHLC